MREPREPIDEVAWELENARLRAGIASRWTWITRMWVGIAAMWVVILGLWVWRALHG
jgi:hypothetical protein